MERLLDGRLLITAGDITESAVDAAVYAATSSPLGRGRVDGAIRRRGGPAMSRRSSGCGDQVLTPFESLRGAPKCR